MLGQAALFALNSAGLRSAGGAMGTLLIMISLPLQ